MAFPGSNAVTNAANQVGNAVGEGIDQAGKAADETMDAAGEVADAAADFVDAAASQAGEGASSAAGGAAAIGTAAVGAATAVGAMVRSTAPIWKPAAETALGAAATTLTFGAASAGTIGELADVASDLLGLLGDGARAASDLAKSTAAGGKSTGSGGGAESTTSLADDGQVEAVLGIVGIVLLTADAATQGQAVRAPTQANMLAQSLRSGRLGSAGGLGETAAKFTLAVAANPAKCRPGADRQELLFRLRNARATLASSRPVLRRTTTAYAKLAGRLVRLGDAVGRLVAALRLRGGNRAVIDVVDRLGCQVRARATILKRTI